jgi:hypothetical protein
VAPSIGRAARKTALDGEGSAALRPALSGAAMAEAAIPLTELTQSCDEPLGVEIRKKSPKQRFCA